MIFFIDRLYIGSLTPLAIFIITFFTGNIALLIYKDKKYKKKSYRYIIVSLLIISIALMYLFKPSYTYKEAGEKVYNDLYSSKKNAKLVNKRHKSIKTNDRQNVLTKKKYLIYIKHDNKIKEYIFNQYTGEYEEFRQNFKD